VLWHEGPENAEKSFGNSMLLDQESAHGNCYDPREIGPFLLMQGGSGTGLGAAQAGPDWFNQQFLAYP
jgi:hypothetical protein